MKKLNNKGFTLVETLIVSAFVVGIFTLMYVNLLPLMGEYEKRENYDNLDNLYKTYFIKRLIENDSDYKSSDCSNTLKEVSCSKKITRKDNYCEDLWRKMNVTNVYLTKYDSFDQTSIDKYLESYLQSLPKIYNNTSNNSLINNKCNCRIIVKYGKDEKDEKSEFSTIGVKLE